jgi:hypothetical protein
MRNIIWNPNMKRTTIFRSMLVTMLLSGVASGQQRPTTGYAPVNGLKMYYEIHGSGEPVVLLHGAFMAISGDWRVWIGELYKTQVHISKMRGISRLVGEDFICEDQLTTQNQDPNIFTRCSRSS